MSSAAPARCGCPHCCADPAHPEWGWHQHRHLLLGTLDEAQRRWYVAVEANRLGRGGTRRLAASTGMAEKTIRRGRRELAAALTTVPMGRVRQRGGGRPALEKSGRSW